MQIPSGNGGHDRHWHATSDKLSDTVDCTSKRTLPPSEFIMELLIPVNADIHLRVIGRQQ
jgi:hypothetical protein